MSSIFSEFATPHNWVSHSINSNFAIRLCEFWENKKVKNKKRGKKKKSACLAGAKGTLPGSGSMSFALWWKKVEKILCEYPCGCLQANSIRTLLTFQAAFHCQVSHTVRPCQNPSAQHGDTTEIQAGHCCLPHFPCGCMYVLPPWQTLPVCA